MAGLLADLYSAIDSKKRQLKGLLDDPAETLKQGLLNFRDDQNKVIADAGVGFQMPGYQSVLLSDEQIKAARNRAIDAYTNQAMAATFIGPGAKTWDALSAKKAQDMAAQGVDPRKIWSETGTWKGPDGKWRQEIPDNAAKMTGDTEKSLYLNIKPQDKLNDVMAHKKLYESYPLGEIGVKQYPGLGASYSPGYTNEQRAMIERLGVDVDPVLMEQMKFGVNTGKSSVIHEAQHAIQQREGWAKGGSPDVFEAAKKEADSTYKLFHNTYKNNESEYLARTRGIGKTNPSLASLSTDTIKQNMDSAYNEVKAAQRKLNENYDPQAMYRLLAGEAEARATQARIPMDAAQRRATFPLDSYDVPVDQLIIRGLLDQ